jgi:hypothetical protein
MIKLASNAAIETFFDEIDGDVTKTKQIPIIASDMKIKLYYYQRCLNKWLREMENMEEQLTDRYKGEADPQTGNSIAILHTYAQVFKNASGRIYEALVALQSVGGPLVKILNDIEEEEKVYKEEVGRIEELIDAFGPADEIDDLTDEELSELDS